MGNVPISCCRSKSPKLDSQFRGNDSHDSNRLSSKPGDPSSSSSSIHHSAQNILQHISEREPDDNETDPLNKPIFAQWSHKLSNQRTQGSYGLTSPSMVRKASSCSTIFIDNSTISQPNLDQTIKCVSLVIHYHIKGRSSDAAAEIFDETLHPLRMPTCPQELVMSNSLQQQQQLSTFQLIKPLQDQSNSLQQTKDEFIILGTDSRTVEPDQETIHTFVKTLFKAAQLTSEYAITALVYLERLMTYAEIDLTPRTWRRMFLGAILLSSKVWEDQAIWNVDYAQILEEISVGDINELERQFLELIQFNMNVPSSVYAKYYFQLRTLAIQNGFMGDHTLLTTGQARELEAMSKVHATDDLFSSPIHRKSPPAIKKYTSLEKLRFRGKAKAVLM